MPVYEYVNAETGEIVEWPRSVDERNEPLTIGTKTFTRSPRPLRVGQILGCSTWHPVDDLKKSYHKIDCKNPDHFKRGKTYKQIQADMRKIASQPPAPNMPAQVGGPF